nr:hypothetical protein [Tanacetum cinerariifolium]
MNEIQMQSKKGKVDSSKALNADLVVIESSGIESENNSLENALSKLVNETQMQMQEVKVYMSKALDDGLVVTESIRTESEKIDSLRDSMCWIIVAWNSGTLVFIVLQMPFRIPRFEFLLSRCLKEPCGVNEVAENMPCNFPLLCLAFIVTDAALYLVS